MKFLRKAWSYFTDFLNTLMIIITTLCIIPIFVGIIYFLIQSEFEKSVAMGILFYILTTINLKLGGSISE